MLVLATAASPADAVARRVTVLVVTGPQPPAVRAGAAVGLYVAGKGLHVSREEALERLGIGEFVGRTCGTLRRCPIEIFVSVPALGSQPNTRRYDVTIRGEGFRGLLVSERTRIPGLLAIEDVGETVRALERREEPPVEVRRVADPVRKLTNLDARIDDARRAQGPATWALTLVAIALASLALVTREPVVARGALAYPIAALLAAIVVAVVQVTGPGTTTVAVLFAASLALGVGRAEGDAFGLAIATGLALYGVVLAVDPEANALAGIGPHPWNGGRFHGVTNQVETILLAPALAAGAALTGWRIAAVASLGIFVVGTSKAGADGGGLVVLTAAFVFLWLGQPGRRSSPLVGALIVAVAASAVALDLATDGSSHVVETIRDGPGALWEAFDRRLRLSWSIVTSTFFQAIVFVAGIGVLGWLATLRPRASVVDAFLVGLAVSLLVNDSPTKVVGFGAVLAAALRALAVSAPQESGIQSRT